MMHINIYFTNNCSRRYWPLYPWYIKPPPVYGILTPYPCYIEPLANCFYAPIPLPIVYQIPVYGIMTPCTHGISKALPMVYRPPLPTTQVMINPYLCYIKPYVYGILILPMVFWPPNYGTSIAFVLNCLLSKTAKECFTPLIVSYIYQSSCGKKGGSTYHDEFTILCVFDVALCNKVCQWYNLGLKLHS